MQQPTEIKFPAEMKLPQDVFDVYESDDVIEIPFINRQPRKTRHCNDAEHFLRRGIDVDSVDVDSGLQDILHGSVAEPQGFCGDLTFDGVKNAAGFSFFQELFDVFSLDRCGSVFWKSEHSEHEIANAVHDPKYRSK